MVNLTRIYTRTGDDGTTALGDFSRTDKNDLRLIAYADVDEANSVLGVAASMPDLPDDLRAVLTGIQNDLFDVGADLCVPIDPAATTPALRVTEEYVASLEPVIDSFNARLEPLRSFVLPAGTPLAAQLHVARTVARRAERAAWAAQAAHPDTVSPLPARYLNRLSDLLFVLARVANLPDAGGDGDVLWQPGRRQS